VVAGGLIGAIIGVLVALLWEPVASRVPMRSATA
jgi:gas vesicle protein